MNDFVKSNACGMKDEPPRYECRICWYLYDPAEGDTMEQVPAGTAFQELPDHWRCPQCDAEQFAFLAVDD